MVQNAARKIELAEETEDAVGKILDLVKADTRQNCRSRCSEYKWAVRACCKT